MPTKIIGHPSLATDLPGNPRDQSQSVKEMV